MTLSRTGVVPLRTLLAGAVSGLVLYLGPAPVAFAQDPGRWVQAGHSATPISYYQGVTSDPQGNFYFDGVFVGLYRTDSALNERGRNDNSIPPTVALSEGYNHVGDLTWDDAAGGALARA